MDSSHNLPTDDEDLEQLPMDQNCKKRKGRGSTRLSDVVKDRSSGVRKVIQYNERGQPIGEHKAKYSSYLEVLARQMVPIDYISWHKVTDELKDKLWSCVELSFDVDPRSRKQALSSMASDWRTFKKTLTKHILTNKSNPELISGPPAKYNFIEQRHWDTFVEGRLSKDFEALSELQRYRQSQNVCRHRISRMGYPQLEQKLKSTVGTTCSLDRSFLWKKACQNKDGEYDNEEIELQAARIDEVTEQVKDGSLTVEGSNDILTIALGTPEHSGRVRGVGNSVTPSAFFHIPRRGIHSQCEEKHKALETRLLQVEGHISAIGQQAPHTPQSEHVSSNTFKSNHIGSPQLDHMTLKKEVRSENCMAPPDPKRKLKKSQPCKLAVEVLHNIVALGTMYERVGPEEVIHTVRLGEANVRVSIDFVIQNDALLPVPIEGEITTVGEAMGYQVAWPKDLVLLGDEGASKEIGVAGNGGASKKVGVAGNGGASKKIGMAGNGRAPKNLGNKKVQAPTRADKGQFGNYEATSRNIDVDENWDSIQSFATYVEHLTYDDATNIPLENAIFGKEIEIHVQKRDAEYICHMKELSITCIMLYISHLHQVLKASNLEKRFLFVNPCEISVGTKTSTGTSKSGLLANRLEDAENDQLIFVPYNIGYHWVLFVINLSSPTIYYLDSLGREINQNIAILFKTALKIYDAEKGKRKRSITWNSVECPRQPTQVECGFYVMRYIKDLITDQGILSNRNFNGKETYTQAEIDEVRVEWINFALKYM